MLCKTSKVDGINIGRKRKAGESERRMGVIWKSRSKIGIEVHHPGQRKGEVREEAKKIPTRARLL